VGTDWALWEYNVSDCLSMCAVYRLIEGYCSMFLINCDMGILDVFTVLVGFVYSIMFPVWELLDFWRFCFNRIIFGRLIKWVWWFFFFLFKIFSVKGCIVCGICWQFGICIVNNFSEEKPVKCFRFSIDVKWVFNYYLRLRRIFCRKHVRYWSFWWIKFWILLVKLRVNSGLARELFL
jgi:hypothetical protein